MSDKKDSMNRREKPPEGDSDWSYLWDSADKAQKTWLVSGPIVAIVTHWKAFAAIAALILAINSPEILAAIKVFLP